MEEWKPFGSYEVSNMGRVKGMYGNILKLRVNKNGYPHFSRYINGKPYNISTHRAVALTWIPNPDNLPEVDHINRNKQDNRVENLRWISRSENCKNKGVQSNNILGYKYISVVRVSGIEYFRIVIYKRIKHFNKSKYTLEQVIAERDKICEELKITF